LFSLGKIFIGPDYFDYGFLAVSAIIWIILLIVFIFIQWRGYYEGQLKNNNENSSEALSEYFEILLM